VQTTSTPPSVLLLPPLHLLDLRERHAPALEVRADAERDEEARAARRQVLHGLHVEVVVVVVRDEHGVDRRQVGERDRRRMEALRPDRDRRHALGEDRVEQQAQPVDLDVDAGVADPEGAQAAGGGAAASAALSTASTGSGAGGTRTSSPENWRTM
jgi:hypothetical protein